MNKQKDHIIIPFDIEKAFDKNPIPFYYKGFEEIMDIREIFKIIMAIYSKTVAKDKLDGDKQHNSTKMRNETRLSTLFIPTQYSILYTLVLFLYIDSSG